MRSITLTLTDAEYDKMLHACEKARKTVTLPKQAVERAMIDRMHMIGECKRVGIKIEEKT